VTTTAPTDVLLHLPLAALIDAPDNLRADVGDVSNLAESIRSVGLLEPLIVTGGSLADEYLLVAGHRRKAAAAKAGLDTVPCIVRHYTEAERTEVMLVENLHREGLDPIEEAHGYQRLTELGLSQRTIAERVGRTQPHVSKRLALLKIPEPAQARVIEGTLTLEAAADLAAMPPESQQRAITEGAAGNLEYSIGTEKRRLAAKERYEKLQNDLSNRGVTVVTEPDHNRGWYLGATDKPGALPREIEQDDHPQTVACCVVELRPGSNWASWYCIDADHRPEPRSPQQGGIPGSTTQEDARLAALEAAAAARLDAARTAIGDQPPTELIQHAAAVFAAALRRELTGEVEAAKILGIEPDQLCAHAHRSSADALRLICAAALGLTEGWITSNLRWRSLSTELEQDDEHLDQGDPGIRGHYALLATHGYQPTDEEETALAAKTDSEGADAAV
jgi:ParB/RepB/Spo0J family partition protein